MFVKEGEIMGGLNNIGSNYQVSSPNERISIRRAGTGNNGYEEKLNIPPSENTKEYAKLFVGDTVKQLEKLGLLDNADGTVKVKLNQQSENIVTEKSKKRAGLEECETCANRKYQDGSDEMVSFKSATHVAPEAAASAVRSHEGEHVSNAYKKASEGGGEVINASVSIHTAICPECGRVYVSGGTTTTNIRYNADKYASNAKEQDASVVPGRDVDTVV